MSSFDDRAPHNDERLEHILRLVLDAGRSRPKTTAGALLAAACAPERAIPNARLLRRAEAIFEPARPGVLKLVLRRVGRALEVLDLVGERLEPAPARGNDEEGVMVRHRFGDREVATHVSAAGSDVGFLLSLDLWPHVDGRGPRVSLFRGARELTSEHARHGRVLFKELSPGTYRVVLSDRGDTVGELDLTLDDAAASPR